MFQEVYYESLKRELKTKTIYGCRCDERLKTNFQESTRLACTPDVLCAFFISFSKIQKLNFSNYAASKGLDMYKL